MPKPKIIPIKGDQLPLPVEKPKQEPVRRLSSAWVASGVICEKLGISPKHLWRLRDEGLLRKDVHWRNIARPQAGRPTYRWHLQRCESALEIDPEMRG